MSQSTGVQTCQNVRNKSKADIETEHFGLNLFLTTSAAQAAKKYIEILTFYCIHTVGVVFNRGVMVHKITSLVSFRHTLIRKTL